MPRRKAFQTPVKRKPTSLLQSELVLIPQTEQTETVLLSPDRARALDAVIGGSVTSADTVELVLLNNTAGAVDLGSQKLRIVVLRVAAQYDIV